MSMYNLLHGENPASGLLLKMLGIDQPGGKWSSGRFRDIHLNADGTEIVLFTRNGGGNREHYDDTEPGIGCGCTGCTIEYHLPRHPNYIRDWDDEFDCTYASIAFSVPDEWKALASDLATGVEPASFEQKFCSVMAEMKAMTPEQIKSDPRFAPIFRALEQTCEPIKK